MALWDFIQTLNPFAAGSPFTAISNLINNPNETWDQFKNGQTNVVNKQIADQNLKFQRENLDYEKALQREIFQREDTAYQRTVADMRAAGLNPISMQGTNGAGEVIPTEPLQNQYQHQDTGSLQAISQIFNTINQMSVARNNASLQQAQSNLINQQAENQRIKNLFEEDLLSKSIESSELSNIGKRFDNERSNIAWLNDQANLRFNTQFGLTDNMPDIIKLSSIMSGEKVYARDHVNFKRNSDSFGTMYNFYGGSDPSNYMTSQQLKGAIMENQLLNGLLSLIPMGIGKLFGGK